MLIHFNIHTLQFLDTTGKTEISVDAKLERCPNINEWIEIGTEEGYFYGIVTSIETYINVKENKSDYYVRVSDKTEINN